MKEAARGDEGEKDGLDIKLTYFSTPERMDRIKVKSSDSSGRHNTVVVTSEKGEEIVKFVIKKPYSLSQSTEIEDTIANAHIYFRDFRPLVPINSTTKEKRKEVKRAIRKCLEGSGKPSVSLSIYGDDYDDSDDE